MPVAVTAAVLALLVCSVAAVAIWKRKKRAESQSVEMVTARVEDTSVRSNSDYGLLPTASQYATAVNASSHYDELTPVEAGRSFNASSHYDKLTPAEAGAEPLSTANGTRPSTP